jgi:Zn-dependent protease
MALVSVAGAAGNFMTAAACGVIVRLIPGPFMTIPALGRFAVLMVLINLGLGVFNLIPVPPLDGSKLLYLVLPPKWLQGYFWLERYGFFVLIILLMTGIIQAVMSPIVRTLFYLIL